MVQHGMTVIHNENDNSIRGEYQRQIETLKRGHEHELEALRGRLQSAEEELRTRVGEKVDEQTQ